MREVKKTHSSTTPKKTGLFFKKSEADAFFKPPAIQPKLTVGEPDDMYEQEADSMAKKVVQQKPIFESKQDGVENTIQRKSDTGGGTASEGVENQLNGAAGSGSPLSPGTRDKMESSFGEDFSKV